MIKYSDSNQNRLILIFVISADSITPFWPLSATLPHFNVRLKFCQGKPFAEIRLAEGEASEIKVFGKQDAQQ